MDYSLLVLLASVIFFVFVIIVIARWAAKERSKGDAFFEKNPLAGFWNDPRFKNLNKEDFDLFSVTGSESVNGLVLSVLDEKSELWACVELQPNSNILHFEIKNKKYILKHPKNFMDFDSILYSDSGRLIASGQFVTYEHSIKLSSEDSMKRVPQENGPFDFTFVNTDHWMSSENALIGIVYRPINIRSLDLKVLAIKKGLLEDEIASLIVFSISSGVPSPNTNSL